MDQVNEEPEDQEAVRRPVRRRGRPRGRRAPIWGRPIRNFFVVEFSDEEEEEEEEEVEENAVDVGQLGDNGGDEEDEEDQEEDQEEDPEDEEDEEDEEEDEEEDDEEDEDDEKDGAEEENVNNVFLLYFQLKKILTKHEFERLARGLPAREIPQFDPIKLTSAVWKLIVEPDEESYTPTQEDFLEQFCHLMDLADHVTKKQPEIKMVKPHRQPGQFKLPENIRERLRTAHVQILESSIDLLRDALVKGMKFDGLGVFSKINEMALEEGEDDLLIPEGELEDIINNIVRTDDEERRRKAYEEMDQHHLRRGGEKIRLPEAQILHLPRIPKEDWRCWTKEDVLDWIKFFIPLQAHRELIEVQHFTGKELDKFLKSEKKWVEAGWPFGLYIRIRSHFNRVVNRNNRFPYLFS